MKRLGKVVLFVLVVVATASAAITAMTSATQEHDPHYPRTRQWQVGVIDPWTGTTWADRYYIRVFVIDTAGVCIYVTHTNSPEVGGIKTNTAAVPKSQLPSGTGCQ